MRLSERTSTVSLTCDVVPGAAAGFESSTVGGLGAGVATGGAAATAVVAVVVTGITPALAAFFFLNSSNCNHPGA